MSAAQDTATKPTSKVEWIKAEDGHEIFTKTWYAVGTPVASVVFVHGLGEHIVRYDHVFEEFNKAGFQVSSYDQRGFGQTGKKSKTLGRTGGYVKAIPDITAALERGTIEGVPLFLMGHSYGGSLVLNYDCIGPLRTKLSGLIASAPLVLPTGPTRPSNLTVSFAGAVSKVFPSLKIPTNLSSKAISRDPKEVAKYDADPLVHGFGTTKGLFDMLTNGKMLLSAARYGEISPDVPVLICHGSADALTEQKASKDFFDKIAVKDKEYKVYEDHYHELHNEPEDDRKVVIDYYIQWILVAVAEVVATEAPAPAAEVVAAETPAPNAVVVAAVTAKESGQGHYHTNQRHITITKQPPFHSPIPLPFAAPPQALFKCSQPRHHATMSTSTHTNSPTPPTTTSSRAQSLHSSVSQQSNQTFSAADAARHLSQEHVSRASQEMFRKVADYIRAEMLATGEDYKLLENMNIVTKDRYSELAGVAQELMQEVGKLRTTYSDFEPYLERIDEISQQAETISNIAAELDEYTKSLGG
ncbi:hypothetical protein BGZ89_001371 [Linnemannia elongata]|nr:hypothetical protein BGZ89_001371 [Linnemannia elongata]